MKVVIALCLMASGAFASQTRFIAKPNRAFFIGGGLGISSNLHAEGFGGAFVFGYQADIRNTRWRFAPHLALGSYSTKGTNDVPDAFFNVGNIKANLNYDVIRVKSFSVFIGSGIGYNRSSGLIGDGGWPGTNNNRGYFTENHLTLGGYVGLRLNSTQKRLAYELLIFDGSWDLDNPFYEEHVMNFRLVYKLN